MSHKKNIYLLREASGSTNNKQQVLDTSNTFLNIDNLRIAIVKELTKKWNIILQDPNDMYSKEAQDVIESYCVMCSLLGNDFIPHLLTLNLKADGLEKLITYTAISYRTNGLLVQDSVINYMALSDILQNIAKTEDKDIYTITEKYMKSSATHHTQHMQHNNIYVVQNASEYYAIKNKDSLAEKIYTNITHYNCFWLCQ
jgi:5'-3' exonuclease